MPELYPDKVKVVFKHFPLRNHSYALKAAIATEAAGKQGKFWQMHDKIFADFRNLSDEVVEQFATELELDLKMFNKDLKEKDISDKVRNDFQEGVAAGVRGTPTVYINGKLMKSKSLEAIKKEIERLLAQKKP